MSDCCLFVASIRSSSPSRGGVPVAAEVARTLGAPLDVIVVRKLGVPFQPELGFGAIGEGDVTILDRDLVWRARLGDRDVDAVIARERAELERRVAVIRSGRPPGTGARADGGDRRRRHRHRWNRPGSRSRWLAVMGAREVVVACWSVPPETVARLRSEADQVLCLLVPPHFVAVGQWYENFDQTSDREVGAALREANQPGGHGSGLGGEVSVRAGDVDLAGELVVPEPASGIVLFAHGSGSSRHSPADQSMARALRGHGFGTLLFDLLTEEEAADRRHVFDVALLGERLLGATVWACAQPVVGRLAVGYFGASTGAAAALSAAAAPGNEVAAVVAAGGRTWPGHGLPWCDVRPSSSSVPWTLRSSALNRKQRHGCGASTSSRSCLARRTSSKNPVRWKWWPGWRSTGSRATSGRTPRPILEHGAVRIRHDRGMIFGTHLVVFSQDADADRSFLSDMLGFDSVDAGGGWLIFALPSVEMAVHPSDNPGAELYLMCDDLTGS